jgi:thiol-disulfide isomerase/thioredoxin
MKKYSYLLFIVVALMFSACSKKDKKSQNTQETKQEQQAKATNKQTNTITLKSVDGKDIVITKTEKGFKFSDSKDKIVLVSFFATWCPPCKAEIPHLNNLQEKYKDKLKIIGILIESGKSSDEVKRFINSFAINYTIANSPANMDFADAVGGVKNIPFMLMYDKKGDYVTHYLGAIPEEMIDSDIQQALKR